MTARTGMLRAWWDYHENLALLFRYLVDNDKIGTDPGEVEYFLSRPDKWTSEWNELTSRGQS